MLDDRDIDCIVATLREMASSEGVLRISELERRVRERQPEISYEDILWLLGRDLEWWQRRGEKLARLAVAQGWIGSVH